MNRLQRLLLGAGQLPADLRAELVAEGPLMLTEGLVGSVTKRHYRDRHSRANWEKQAVSGAIAVTRHRFVVWAGRSRHIDVPLAHPLRASIDVTVEAADRICFGYDPSRTNPGVTGRIEVRLRTPEGQRIHALLHAG